MEDPKAVQGRVGARIRLLRQRQRRSQEQVAQTSRMATSFLRQVEKGLGNPSLESLVSIANALGVPLSDLMAAEELDQFKLVDEKLRKIPASMRVLALKLFDDTLSLIEEAEKTAARRR